MELVAAVLLGMDGQVLGLNSTAKSLLETIDGLSLRVGFLKLSPVFHPEGVLRVSRPSGKPDFIVWTTSMLNGGEKPGYRLVTIYDPAHREEAQQRVLASMFRLTVAEARLAEQVIQGHSPSQAAANLGVTIYTVRTYLKRLYHKVGVKSQAGLVRALLKAIESVSAGFQAA